VIAEIRTKLGIPVIVYSGFEGYESAVRAADIEHYFKTPFGMEEFRTAVRATIDKYRL
jgi:DNA-binding NtrC family response regulator